MLCFYGVERRMEYSALLFKLMRAADCVRFLSWDTCKLKNSTQLAAHISLVLKLKDQGPELQCLLKDKQDLS